jgi:electron transfer flavoprotein alpha subunit
MATGIIALAEQSDGELKKISAEVCSEAVRLGAAKGLEVSAITIGPGAAKAAEALGDHGVTRCIAIEGDGVAAYSGEAYAKAIADCARDEGAALLLIGATTFARDLLGRLGALLDSAPCTDATAVDWSGDHAVVTRPVYAGKANLKVACTATPGVVSLRGNVFAADTGKGASVQVDPRDPGAAPARCAVLADRIASDGATRAELTEAEIVVSGGRGLKDPDTFTRLIEPLADVLGAAVGASRAVVDAGWRPHAEQVGQTGKTVAPKLYIAAGISGAIQHLAGMKTAGTIVAINKDPDAPIFKVADYGIVGDVEEVLPALTEQAKALLS